MTHGQYCDSCGGFPDHTQICCFVDNGDGGFSNIQNVVVDCTLSLGTPSTRLSEKRRSNSSSRVSKFLDTNKNSSKTSSCSVLPFSKRRISGGGDTLLDRRYTNCDTTSTPLWRNGPRGPKSLCNACGIRFKKEERRTTNPVVTVGNAVVEDQYGHHHSSSNATENGSSRCNYAAGEIRFIHDYGGAGEYYRRDPVDGVNGVPFHSWRLNVADTATSLVYDFTRRKDSNKGTHKESNY